MHDGTETQGEVSRSKFSIIKARENKELNRPLQVDRRG
jgi:hypothetical protein